MTDSRDAAMIVAAYADCRAYRSLNVVRITCELDLKDEAEVHRRIGYPGKDKTVVISLVDPDKVKAYGPPPDAKEAPAKPKRKWEELSAREQAVLRCKEPKFWEYLHAGSESEAAHIVKGRCRVESRSELDTDNAARFTWVGIDKRYQAYLTEQRHADNLSRG